MEISEIELLSGSDEKRAKEAFDRLYKGIQSHLSRYLISRISNPQDREEIIAKSCVRIWNVRTRFKAQNLGAWYQHLSRTCWWIAIDHLRTKHEDYSLEENGLHEIACEAVTSNSSTAHRRLHNLADQVWLGWDSSILPIERKRRVLAAQLFHLHGRKWADVAVVVKLRPDLDREKFDDWISQKSTLLHLSFKELHAGNQELCEILLGERPIMSPEGEHGCHRTNWTPEQIEFIRYRFQYGIELGHFPADLATQTIEACLKLFPFIDRFERIEKKVAKANLLSTVGLWKRIVFQYHAVNDLKYKQIQERTEPIATRAGQKMNDNTMQAWLSSGRLAKQLKDAL